MDKGETIDQTFEREVFEETGMRAKRGKLLLAYNDFFTHPASKKHFQTILLYYSCADVEGELSDGHFSEAEKLYAKPPQWISLEEVEKLKFYNPVDSVALIKMAAEGKGV